jgi:protein-disulfide isomerase
LPRPILAASKARARQSSPAVVARLYRRYWYALALGVLAATLLILLSQLSVRRSTAAGVSQQPAGIAESKSLLAGIPQHGNALGSPSAPVRLIEYADPQCPYCALYARYVFPVLVREYVRPGSVELVYRGLGFIGFDSEIALRAAVAAGGQNRFWNVIDLIYRNQGPENAWLTEAFLRQIVTGAGANAPQAMAARGNAAVTARLNAWSTLASTHGVKGVPAFFLGRRGAPVRRLLLRRLDLAQFRGPLDRALQR